MEIKTTTINGISFSFLNEKEFTMNYNEIFNNKHYKFTANVPAPFILDCGANIGVSILYFKSLYPQSRVIAFEPEPEAFKLLEFNIRQNNLSGVELVNAAVSNITGEIDFFVPEPASLGSAGVKNSWHRPDNHKTIRVPAVKLSSYINEPIDMLKIDVEGMEEIVLMEVEKRLEFVKNIRMEFHGCPTNQSNDLERILSILNRNHFKFMIKQEDSQIINIVRVNQMKFVEINRVAKNQFAKGRQRYFLMIYSSRSNSAMWWQALVLSQSDRVLKVPGRFLAGRSSPPL